MSRRRKSNPKIIATAVPTLAPRLSTGWESGEALFKGGTQNRPKRTLTWKLGVDAKFEKGRIIRGPTHTQSVGPR